MYIISGEWGGTEISEGMLAMMAIFLIIPVAAAILSLTLNNSANRWLNFILGIIWFLWLIFGVVEHATGEATVYATTWMIFATGLVIAALIA